MSENIIRGGVQVVTPNPPPAPKVGGKWGTQVPRGDKVKKELPNTPSAEAFDAACKILIVTMVSTNADRLKSKYTRFHDKDGVVYGDFVITVKKIKENKK